LPDLDATLPNDRVEFYRVNTVQSGWLQNTLASGCIETDWTIRSAAPPHYPVSQSSCPFDELLAVAHQATNPALPAIRILVMHHPPHFFNATGTPSDLKAGALNNASDLGAALAKSAVRFHLVLAGHRHELNPAIGVRLTYSLASGGWQKPLPPTVVQLVAGSPTQLAQGTDRPSFSVYRLEVDANQLAVERTVYYLQSDLDTAFTILCCEKTVSCLPV
jgi:3',5'-cyclic AMP phosphodiesterase CpdA